MIMQHIRERAVAAALTAIAIVFALSYLKSCTQSHAPAATSVSSMAAPMASTRGASRQVAPGCPEIPLSASGSEMRTVMAKCGRAADADQARIEAKLAAQSKAAWAAQAKRADDAQAAFNSPAPTATAASDIDGPLTLVLPSQAPPVGLQPGRADYELASARPAHEFGTIPGEFVRIGSAPVTAATSSFGSLPDKDLAAMAPKSGFARETWTFWIQFKNAGPHVMALRFDGGWGSSASIALDDQPKPVVTVKSESVAADQQSAVGSVNVAAGWHKATITLIQYANVIRTANTEVDLFVRGPSAGSPISITPFAAATVPNSPPVNSTKPAAPAPAAHLISSGAFIPATHA